MSQLHDFIISDVISFSLQVEWDLVLMVWLEVLVQATLMGFRWKIMFIYISALHLIQTVLWALVLRLYFLFRWVHMVLGRWLRHHTQARIR